MNNQEAVELGAESKQMVCDFIDDGLIDGNLLVQVAQIMAIREFAGFFSTLCQINLGDVDHSAKTLHQCAQQLVIK